MSHHDHHAGVLDAPKDETIIDLLAKFIPGAGEFAALVGGVFAGAGILGVLSALALLINGHIGIWPTF